MLSLLLTLLSLRLTSVLSLNFTALSLLIHRKIRALKHGIFTDRGYFDHLVFT
jgi:hypothetical protein